MKISKEYFFISITVLFITIIGIFNYLTDPYNLLWNKNTMSFWNKPLDLIFPTIEAYKSKKYHRILLGSSPFNSSMAPITTIPPQSELLTHQGGDYEFLYKMLKKYIELHPETKEVIIQIDSLPLLIPEKRFQEDNSNEHVKNISKLLFSFKATKRSFEKAIIPHMNKYRKKGRNIVSVEEGEYKEVYPYFFLAIKPFMNKETLIEKNCNDFKNIHNLLKEKNIKVTYISLPANVIHLVYLYKTNDLIDIVNATKKYIVEELDTPIYEMAFVNKYTSLSMLDENNFAYRDYSHPHEKFWFIKIYKILFDIENADKDLYLVLDKTNFDTMLNKEKELLDNYIKNNKELIDKQYQIFNDVENKKLDQYQPFKRYINKSNLDLSPDNAYWGKLLEQNKY